MNIDYTSVRLEVTSKCNLNCAYCHNASHSNNCDDMSSEELLKLIHELKRKYNIGKILLTGGEPLVKSDICNIVAEITALGIKADMVTNGTLLDLKLLKELEAAGLKRIRLSIDEVADATAVRGDSSPNALWETAEMVVQNSNIELCIHTVASPFNVKKLYDVYQKVLSVGARRWRVFDLGYQGDFVSNSGEFDLETYYQDLIASTKQILIDFVPNKRNEILDIEINNIFRTEFLDMDPKDFVDFDRKKTYEARLLRSPCSYVSAHQISIRSDGKGTLCQYFHNPIYDFKKSGFDADKAVAELTPYDEFILQMQDMLYCKRCKYNMVCNSGCRARALFLTDDMQDADPGACYLHPLVHKEIMTMLPKHVLDIYEGYILPDGLEPKYSMTELKEFLRKRGYNA